MLLLLCEQEVSWDLCLKTDQKGVLYESNIRLLRVGRYVGVQTGSTGHAARGRRRRVTGGDTSRGVTGRGACSSVRLCGISKAQWSSLVGKQDIIYVKQ